jgi:hypothetical protein
LACLLLPCSRHAEGPGLGRVIERRVPRRWSCRPRGLAQVPRGRTCQRGAVVLRAAVLPIDCAPPLSAFEAFSPKQRGGCKEAVAAGSGGLREAPPHRVGIARSLGRESVVPIKRGCRRDEASAHRRGEPVCWARRSRGPAPASALSGVPVTVRAPSSLTVLTAVPACRPKMIHAACVAGKPGRRKLYALIGHVADGRVVDPAKEVVPGTGYVRLMTKWHGPARVSLLPAHR